MKNITKEGSPIERRAKDMNFLSTEQINLGSDTIARGFFRYRFKKNGTAEVRVYERGVLDTLEALGYRIRRANETEEFVKVENNVLQEVSRVDVLSDMREILTRMKDKITVQCDGKDVDFTKAGLEDVWTNWHSGRLHDRFLQNLKTFDKPMMNDTRTASYLFYKNGFVEVTKDGIELKDYSKMTGCIWHDEIIQRDFTEVEVDVDNCSYAKLLWNVSNECTKRFDAFRSAIGYLLHRFTPEYASRAIVLYDEELSHGNQSNGRTGKSIMGQALNQLRKVLIEDGKSFDGENRFKFMEVEPGKTSIYFLDDASKGFSFESFFSNITTGFNVEVKNGRKTYLSLQESPKVLISSNWRFKSRGRSAEERMFVLEFSDYYSKQITGDIIESPIKKEHGILFSEDWDEWPQFDCFMVDCLQFYLKNGLKPYRAINDDSNKAMQSLGLDLFNWIKKEIQKDVRYQTNELYEGFARKHNSDLQQRGFTERIKEYAEIMNLEYVRSRSNGISYFTLEDGQEAGKST